MPEKYPRGPGDTGRKGDGMKLQVHVIGESMLDYTIQCEVSRVSPEAPCLIGKRVSVAEQAGGAARVVAQLGRLGAEVIFTTSATQESCTRTRYKCGEATLFRHDVDRVCESIPLPDKTARVLVLSDYNKGLFRNIDMRKLAEFVELADFVVADLKPSTYNSMMPLFANALDTESTPMVVVFTPNSKEALEYNDWIDGAHYAVTMGSDGVNLFKGDETGQENIRHAEDFQAVDVCGCGDVFTAGLAYWLGIGVELRDAVRLANELAGRKARTHEATVDIGDWWKNGTVPK